MSEQMTQSSQTSVIYPRLRPINEHIKDSALLIYKHWLPLLTAQGVMIFASVFIVILSLFIFFTPIFYGLIKGMEGDEIISLLFTSYFWVGIFFMMVPLVIVASWAYGAMILAIGYKGGGMAPVGMVIKKGVQFLFPILILTILVWGAVFGASLLLVFPGVILCVGLLFVLYIRVLENVSVFQAIGTSWEITKGYRWPIFGRILLLILIIWGVVTLLAIAGMIPIMGLISIPIQVVFNFVLTPYMFAYIYLMYEDIRNVRNDVYPVCNALKIFMILSWIAGGAFIGGIITLTVYLISKNI